MKCRSCKGLIRKGSGRLAAVIENGKIESGRVCASCIRTAVMIVSQQESACTCGKKATTCVACNEKTMDRVKREAADAKALAKLLRKRASAYTWLALSNVPEFSKGVATGLEQAADFLEKGSWS
jgi:hypothetical protein